ncbi:MAG: trypsin-like serine protease [Alphaproteobacteria bacterium]|nr:trypsin-like serine protease [Alphaproteobacteria bacterium]
MKLPLRKYPQNYARSQSENTSARASIPTILLFVFVAAVSACRSYESYTGPTSYGGGDETGVTIYGTNFSSIDQVTAVANAHCRKFDRKAELVNCTSAKLNACFFACKSTVAGNLPNVAEKFKKGGHHTPPGPHTAAEKNVKTGTGFFVTHEGHLLTNAHVVHGCKNITLLRVGDTRLSASILAEDRDADLALLKSSAQPNDIANFRSGKGIRVGNDIVTYGFPLTGILSSEGNFSKGSVAAMSGMDDRASLMQISAPVQPGNSGGPLLDYGGNVVGVIVSKLSAVKVVLATGDIPQNVNFAIKRAVATKFLEENNVKYQTHRTGSRLDAADIADIAKKYTIQIVCW